MRPSPGSQPLRCGGHGQVLLHLFSGSQADPAHSWASQCREVGGQGWSLPISQMGKPRPRRWEHWVVPHPLCARHCSFHVSGILTDPVDPAERGGGAGYLGGSEQGACGPGFSSEVTADVCVGHRGPLTWPCEHDQPPPGHRSGQSCLHTLHRIHCPGQRGALRGPTGPARMARGPYSSLSPRGTPRQRLHAQECTEPTT